MKVTINFNASDIMAAHGMGSSDKVQKYLASEVNRLSAPYTPFQSGALSRPQIASDGSEVIYVGPYAHYQWQGDVMAGKPPKHYTGDELTYNGAPMRGARWTERMLADKRKEIENNVETYLLRG